MGVFKGYGNGKSTFRCDHYWRRTRAGLNVALVLGRARKKVTFIDEGRPRNAVTREVHDFLPAAELHRVSFGELRRKTNRFTVCTNGPDELTGQRRDRAASHS